KHEENQNVFFSCFRVFVVAFVNTAALLPMGLSSEHRGSQMRNRFKGSMAATAAVAALFCVGLRTVAGQAPAAPAQPSAQPRTLDGQPDLMGIWQVLNS